MTQEERRAYARGYNAGRKGAWPRHRPPHPPEAIVRRLMDASRSLRDGVDYELAMLDPDDEWTKRLGPLIDEVDSVFIEIGEWLATT